MEIKMRLALPPIGAQVNCPVCLLMVDTNFQFLPEIIEPANLILEVFSRNGVEQSQQSVHENTDRLFGGMHDAPMFFAVRHILLMERNKIDGVKGQYGSLLRR